MLENFENTFNSNADVGFLPSGWSLYYDSGKVVFNQGADSHHGKSSLHADVQYHPTDYSIIETVISGEPGSTIDLQIQVKSLPEDGAIAQIRFAIWEAFSNPEVIMTSYSNPNNEWVTIRLDEIEIDSDGEFIFEISIAQVNSAGYTDVYFDCLTSNDSNLQLKNKVTEFSVTFQANVGGSITGDLVQEVRDGGDCTPVTAVANQGYMFTGWSGDYTGTENTLTITNVTSDMTIIANFTQTRGGVDVGDGGGGGGCFISTLTR